MRHRWPRRRPIHASFIKIAGKTALRQRLPSCRRALIVHTFRCCFRRCYRHSSHFYIVVQIRISVLVYAFRRVLFRVPEITQPPQTALIELSPVQALIITAVPSTTRQAKTTALSSTVPLLAFSRVASKTRIPHQRCGGVGGRQVVVFQLSRHVETCLPALQV